MKHQSLGSACINDYFIELFAYVLQSSVPSSNFGLPWKKHMIELARFKSRSFLYLSARVSVTAKGTLVGSRKDSNPVQK